MHVAVAAGEALVPQGYSATGGGYLFTNTASATLAVATSDPSNPRVDLVVAQVNDAAYHGASNTEVLEVLTGTPTASATLVNKLGAQTVPTGSIALGYVLVPAGSSSVTGGNIENVVRVAEPGLERYAEGAAGSRPAAGVKGRIYYATDTKVYSFDSGTGWTGLAAYAEGTAARRPSAGVHGRIYYATDTKVYNFDTGSAWNEIPVGPWTPPTEYKPNAKQVAGTTVGARLENGGATVRLRGEIECTSGTITELCVLPVGLRPPYTVYMVGVTVTTGVARVFTITSAGLVSSVSGVGSGTPVSLDGITFQATQVHQSESRCDAYPRSLDDLPRREDVPEDVTPSPHKSTVGCHGHRPPAPRHRAFITRDVPQTIDPRFDGTHTRRMVLRSDTDVVRAVRGYAAYGEHDAPRARPAQRRSSRDADRPQVLRTVPVKRLRHRGRRPRFARGSQRVG